jgi:hypothetical protein
MQIFFCSIRTALIYGPATIIEAEAPEERKLSLRAAWEVDYPFDEWEGYAVVVPERNSVWGLSHPTYNGEGEIVRPWILPRSRFRPRIAKSLTSPLATKSCVGSQHKKLRRKRNNPLVSCSYP